MNNHIYDQVLRWVFCHCSVERLLEPWFRVNGGSVSATQSSITHLFPYYFFAKLQIWFHARSRRPRIRFKTSWISWLVFSKTWFCRQRVSGCVDHTHFVEYGSPSKSENLRSTLDIFCKYRGRYPNLPAFHSKSATHGDRISLERHTWTL